LKALGAIHAGLVSMLSIVMRNPILRRETRTRLRGTRTMIVLTTFMAVMTLAFYISYRIILSEYRYNPYQLPEAGRYVFVTLVIIECILIMLIAPAFSCATISSERERGTFELLRTTLLQSNTILVGKLSASVYFILMLLFSSVPVLSTCMLLGGLAPQNIVVSVLVLLGTVFFYALVGLFCSVMFRKTAVAAGASYVAVFLINLLPLGLVVFILIVTQENIEEFLCIASCSTPITNLLETLVPDIRREFDREIGIYSHFITWPLYFIMALVMWRTMNTKLHRELGLHVGKD